MPKTMVIEIVVKIAIAKLPNNSFLLPTLSTKYPNKGGINKLTVLQSKVACLLTINPKPLN